MKINGEEEEGPFRGRWKFWLIVLLILVFDALDLLEYACLMFKLCFLFLDFLSPVICFLWFECWEIYIWIAATDGNKIMLCCDIVYNMFAFFNLFKGFWLLGEFIYSSFKLQSCYENIATPLILTMMKSSIQISECLMQQLLLNK